MAKSEEKPKSKPIVGLSNPSTKGDAGEELREKIIEKAIEVVEDAIEKLEEVLAWLKPHVEHNDAAAHVETAIHKLKSKKEKEGSEAK